MPPRTRRPTKPRVPRRRGSGGRQRYRLRHRSSLTNEPRSVNAGRGFLCYVKELAMLYRRPRRSAQRQALRPTGLQPDTSAPNPRGEVVCGVRIDCSDFVKKVLLAHKIIVRPRAVRGVKRRHISAWLGGFSYSIFEPSPWKLGPLRAANGPPTRFRQSRMSPYKAFAPPAAAQVSAEWRH